MKASYFDVWSTCMTNTCVTFISKTERVPANTGPEAGAAVIKHILEHGAQVQLMHQSPKLPVAVISVCPFQIVESPAKVLQ